MNNHLKKLRSILRKKNLDSIIISNASNILYLSGFNGLDSYLLVTFKDCFLLTDSRYKEEAESAFSDFKVITEGKNLYQKAASVIEKLKLKKTAFEASSLSVKDKSHIEKSISKKLIYSDGVVEKLRIIKDAYEIDNIKQAANVTKLALKRIIKEVKKSKSELQIAAKLDFLLYASGADGLAFKTIVASGANASMPHARPTTKKIKSGEPIVIDFGAKVNGYSSDLTRTLFVGRISERFRVIYNIVSAAQEIAIKKIAPGVEISEIDKAARNYISKKGFGEYFTHATGHCLGIDVHEHPSINSKRDAKLKEGMVLTVEPGIYIPGEGGVRIEDMVLVTKKGKKVLTR